MLVSPIVILGVELSSMDPFLYQVIVGAGMAEALHVMVIESVWLTMNSWSMAGNRISGVTA